MYRYPPCSHLFMNYCQSKCTKGTDHKYMNYALIEPIEQCWNEAVRFLLGVSFLWPGGWNLRSCLSWSATLGEWVIKCHYTRCTDSIWKHCNDVMSDGFLQSLVLPLLTDSTVQDSTWPGGGSPTETPKVVVIDTQRVLDQWLGWHIHWQARYYSSATVPQIVFQVLGISQVTLEAFMWLVRVGPSVCHQCRGSLPAEQEERGHRDLDLVLLAWEESEETAKRCHTKLELTVSLFLFLEENSLTSGCFCVLI